MKLKHTFIVRDVGGTRTAVAIGMDAERFNGMIRLNKTGEFLFNKLRHEVTEQQLIEALCSTYQRELEEARTDVHAFLSQLREYELIDE